jgi:maleylacetoacetate isomerase/maleylpyruvate isomerase
VTEDGSKLTQSLAIIEWLEETHPEPPLLPAAASGRAVVRTMATIIACDIHPLNNMRIQQALDGLGLDSAARNAWSRRWIDAGFRALEPMVAHHGQGWAFGDLPTLADCCLVPQVVNSQRFGVDLSPYPEIAGVWERSKAHAAFYAAAPEQQPDFRPA